MSKTHLELLVRYYCFSWAGLPLKKLCYIATRLYTHFWTPVTCFTYVVRYRAVVHPWKPRFTSSQTAAIIASTWSVSFILVLPYALVLKIQGGYCAEDWPHPSAVKVYTMGLFIFQYALPLLIITFAYLMVARKLRHQAARIARNRHENGISMTTYGLEANGYQLHPTSEAFSVSSPTVQQSEVRKKCSDSAKQDLVPQSIDPPQVDRREVKRLERNTKIMKMLVTVVSLYAICLLPNQVVWLWYEFGTAQSWPHFNELLTFGSIMVYVNSCVNPLLYAGMNDDFRKGFIKLLNCNRKSHAKTLVWEKLLITYRFRNWMHCDWSMNEVWRKRLPSGYLNLNRKTPHFVLYLRYMGTMTTLERKVGWQANRQVDKQLSR